MAVPDLTTAEVFLRVLLALGLGGLVGLERERHRDTRSVVAGIRTLPIISLTGLLSTWLGQELGAPVVAVALLVIGAMTAAYALPRGEVRLGMTTGSAVVAVFLLGVLVALDHLLLAAVTGVALTVLLAMRERLHHFAEVLTEQEVTSALQFLVVAAVLLPLAPDRPVDPWGFLNPRAVLIIIVLVSVLTFVSFLVMRRFGPGRGLPASGFLGGLVSSIAAVGSIASMPLETRRLQRSGAVGIQLAVVASLVRNLAIAFLVVPGVRMGLVLLPVLVAMSGVLGVGVLLSWPRRPREDEPTPSVADLGLIRSPFAVLPALRFGLIFVALSVAAALLQRIPGLGEWGVYLAAAGGLVSSGAVIASMALLLAQGAVDVELAASVSLVAITLALGAKGVVARAAGGPVFRAVWLPVVGAAAVGVLGAALVRM